MENPAILLRRLNPYCARAMEGAASLCQTRAHAEILPEHWLLKLLEQGEGDLTVLARRYVWDMDTIWQDMLGFLDSLPRSVRSRPQLSEGVQALMQDAWLHASLAGEEHIRSIHLLMALVEKPKLLRCDGLWPLLTLAQSQLERLRGLLDAQSDERPVVQQEAELTQGDEVEFVGRPVNADIKGELNPALQNALDRFTLDVTARAREGRIDPVCGRDNEIRQMVDILSRRRKNNPILVGEPGVGKTALVEGLALRIHEGNVPDALKPVSVRTLDLGLLQAGAGVKGEFEQRLKNIIDAVQQSPLPVLLFIDEAHTIIGAGNQAGGADAANLLKPALARGELRTIAATTWSEYKQYFERDAALERRFQMVKVDEPDDDTACLMLRGLKSRYAEHHGVHITDEAVKAAVTLSRRYLTGRQLPDKAVDLLDTASARIRMSLDTIPEPLTRMKAQLTALAMEKQALLEDIAVGNTAHGERLAAIGEEEVAIILQLDERETRYGQELKLTEELLACRTDISRQGEIADLQMQLTAVQQNTPLLGLDVDARTVASVRGGKGILLTADVQPDVGTKMLEMDRAVEQLEQALTLARSLKAAVKGAKATVSDIDSQKTLNSSLKYLKMPGMLASAPAGIGILSPETVRVASGGASIGLMSGKNTDISAGQSFTVAVGEAVSLFAQAAGMKMYAGAGMVDIQAQADAVNVSALQDITVISGQGSVKVNASQELVLSCGGAYIKLSGGNIELGCLGNILLKAANVNQTGPASLDTPPVTFPKGYSEGFITTSSESGAVKPFTTYRITTAEGEVYNGVSSATGETAPIFTSMPSQLKIEYPRNVPESLEAE